MSSLSNWLDLERGQNATVKGSPEATQIQPTPLLSKWMNNMSSSSSSASTLSNGANAWIASMSNAAYKISQTAKNAVQNATSSNSTNNDWQNFNQTKQGVTAQSVQPSEYELLVAKNAQLAARQQPFWKTMLQDCSIQVSYTQRITFFAFFVCTAIVLIGLSFAYLPLVLIGSSYKFVLCYTLAAIFFFTAMCFLVGQPFQQVKAMLNEDRFYITIFYLVSLFATLYTCFVMPYLILVIPLLIVQLGSMILYLLSYTPFRGVGGRVLKAFLQRFMRKLPLPS